MSPTLPDRIADAVSQAEKNHNVKEIAELCGVSPQAVYDWRKKKTINLKGETLVELAEVSGLNARWIINGKGRREGHPSLTPEEQTIVDAFRLFGTEMKEAWLEAARARLAKDDGPKIQCCYAPCLTAFHTIFRIAVIHSIPQWRA